MSCYMGQSYHSPSVLYPHPHNLMIIHFDNSTFLTFIKIPQNKAPIESKALRNDFVLFS